MKRIAFSTVLTLAAATPFTMLAVDIPENPNRFSLGPRLGWNFKASFHNAAPINSGPVAPGADHRYADGYVLRDSSDPADGFTWNWGYQNASQVVGDTMQFNAIEPVAPFGANRGEVTDDPQYGAELIYQRVLGSGGSRSSVHWGIEAALGYTDLDLRDDQSGTGSVLVTTDSYSLNGTIPPGAGYNGTFAGPGPLLSDLPTRMSAAGTATISSRHELSGQSFGFRFGPFVEWDLTSKLSLVGSIGVTVAPTSLDYDFTETTAVAGGGTTMVSGHASETEVLYGFYVSAQLHYDFTDRWGAYVGAQFQSLNDLELTAGSRTAELDPGATVYATAGLAWRF